MSGAPASPPRRPLRLRLAPILGLACLALPAHPARADDPTTRPPGPADDSEHGYAPGNLWNLPGHAEWICLAAAPGAAHWRRLPPQPLPLDAVPGVVLHGWSTRRLRKAYVGPLLIVAPRGRPDLPIGSRADGDLDQDALAAATRPPATDATDDPTRRSVDVTRWPDQVAPPGTAAELSVPQGAVAPQIAARATIDATTGGTPFVAFADGGMNWLTDRDGNATNIQHPRLASAPGAGPAADARDLSVVTVLRGAASGNTLDATVSFRGRFPITLDSQDVTQTTPLYGGAAFGDGAQRALDFFIPSTPSVFALSASADRLSAFDDDNDRYDGPPPTPGRAAGGIVLGGGDARVWGFADALSAVIVGPALTPSQMLALRESLTATFRLTPQLRDRVVLVGASTEAGADGWLTQAPIRSAETRLNPPRLVYNLAIAGSGLAAPPNGILAIWPRAARTLAAKHAQTVYAIGAGALINTRGRGASVAQTIAWLRSWLSLAHGLGPQVRTVCETVMPHGPAEDAGRQAINAAIRAASMPCDAVADVAADRTLGAASIVRDRRWTVADGGHHSPAYQQREGAITGDAIARAMLIR